MIELPLIVFVFLLAAACWCFAEAVTYLFCPERLQSLGRRMLARGIAMATAEQVYKATYELRLAKLKEEKA